jgi:hypothetical protein
MSLSEYPGVGIGIGNVALIVMGFGVSSLDVKQIPKPKHKTLPIPKTNNELFKGA